MRTSFWHPTGLSLDEALALARLLDVAPGHLLSPRDGSTVWLTDQRDVDGAGMRNWLLFGEPLLSDTPTGKRAEMRMRLAFAAETYAQAIVDAKNGDDTAGKNDALRMLHALMNSHADAIASVDEDSIAAHRRGQELFREAVLRAGGTVE